MSAIANFPQLFEAPAFLCSLHIHHPIHERDNSTTLFLELDILFISCPTCCRVPPKAYARLFRPSRRAVRADRVTNTSSLIHSTFLSTPSSSSHPDPIVIVAELRWLNQKMSSTRSPS